MPKLMEQTDWIQTIANARNADGIWCETVSADGDTIMLSVPKGGMYQVILVKMNDGDVAAPPRRKSARDYIGYSRRHRPEWHSTAEVMKELREGEE